MFLNHYGIFKNACNEAHLHFESLFTNEKKNTVLSGRLSEEGEVGSFKPTGFVSFSKALYSKKVKVGND